MKNPLFYFCFLLLLNSQICFSQENISINELDFYALIKKRIDYPISAIRGSIYGRFFTTFEVNEEGKLKNIKVVYPLLNEKVSKRIGFEYEIIDGMKNLFPLRRVHQGKYLLPISFIYSNIYSGVTSFPTNEFPKELYLEKYADYKIIDEIQIFGRSDQYKSLRQYSNIPPESRQVVDF